MEHYYSADPTAKSEERILTYEVNENKFTFISDNGVFSKNHVDFATDFLIRTIIDEVRGCVLDVGCGYGFLGVTLSKIMQSNVDMIDVTTDFYTNEDKFVTYYITVSGHAPYNFGGGNSIASKNQDLVNLKAKLIKKSPDLHDWVAFFCTFAKK